MMTKGVLQKRKLKTILKLLLPLINNNKNNYFQKIGRGHGLARNIKESIFIRVNNPTLNRKIGKFNLPHIWNRVLLNTSGLNLKRHVQAAGHANSNTPIQSTQLPPQKNNANFPSHLLTGSEHVYRIS